MFITQKNTDDYTYKPKTVKNNYGTNLVSFNEKPKAWKNTTLSQSGKASSSDTREKLYDISNSNNRVSVPKRDYLTPKLPNFTANTIKIPVM